MTLNLTEREHEVLERVVKGGCAKVAVMEMGLAKGTVSKAMTAAARRNNCKTHLHLVLAFDRMAREQQ